PDLGPCATTPATAPWCGPPAPYWTRRRRSEEKRNDLGVEGAAPGDPGRRLGGAGAVRAGASAVRAVARAGPPGPGGRARQPRRRRRPLAPRLLLRPLRAGRRPVALGRLGGRVHRAGGPARPRAGRPPVPGPAAKPAAPWPTSAVLARVSKTRG